MDFVAVQSSSGLGFVDLASGVAKQSFEECKTTGDNALAFMGKRSGLFVTAAPRSPCLHVYRCDKKVAVQRLPTPEVMAAVSMTSDGSVLYAASVSGAVYVWHLPTGMLLRNWRMPYGGSLNCLKVSSDDSMLITAGEDATIRSYKATEIFDLSNDKTSGEPLVHRTWTVHGLAVTCLATSGAWVVSCSLDKTVHLWSFHSDKSLKHFNLPGPVVHVALSPTMCEAYACCQAYIFILPLTSTTNTYQSNSRLSGHSDDVRCCAVNCENSLLVSSSSDGVRIWDIRTKQTIRQFAFCLKNAPSWGLLPQAQLSSKSAANLQSTKTDIFGLSIHSTVSWMRRRQKLENPITSTPLPMPPISSLSKTTTPPDNIMKFQFFDFDGERELDLSDSLRLVSHTIAHDNDIKQSSVAFDFDRLVGSYRDVNPSQKMIDLQRAICTLADERSLMSEEVEQLVLSLKGEKAHKKFVNTGHTTGADSHEVGNDNMKLDVRRPLPISNDAMRKYESAHSSLDCFCSESRRVGGGGNSEDTKTMKKVKRRAVQALGGKRHSYVDRPVFYRAGEYLWDGKEGGNPNNESFAENVENMKKKRACMGNTTINPDMKSERSMYDIARDEMRKFDRNMEKKFLLAESRSRLKKRKMEDKGALGCAVEGNIGVLDCSKGANESCETRGNNEDGWCDEGHNIECEADDGEKVVEEPNEGMNGRMKASRICRVKSVRSPKCSKGNVEDKIQSRNIIRNSAKSGDGPDNTPSCSKAIKLTKIVLDGGIDTPAKKKGAKRKKNDEIGKGETVNANSGLAVHLACQSDIVIDDGKGNNSHCKNGDAGFHTSDGGGIHSNGCNKNSVDRFRSEGAVREVQEGDMSFRLAKGKRKKVQLIKVDLMKSRPEEFGGVVGDVDVADSGESIERNQGVELKVMGQRKGWRAVGGGEGVKSGGDVFCDVFDDDGKVGNGNCAERQAACWSEEELTMSALDFGIKDIETKEQVIFDSSSSGAQSDDDEDSLSDRQQKHKSKCQGNMRFDCTAKHVPHNAVAIKQGLAEYAAKVKCGATKLLT